MLERLSRYTGLWLLLSVIIMGLGALTAIDLAKTALGPWNQEIATIAVLGIVTCVAIAILALFVERLAQFSRWLLDRAQYIFAFAAGLITSLLVLVTGNIVIGAMGLALGIVGLVIGIRLRWPQRLTTASVHFHPIRLDQEDRSNWLAPTVDSSLQTYPPIQFPRGKIWLGDVLFEIASKEHTGELMGISVTPDRANNAEVRTIVEQVDSVIEIDVIVSAGNAYKFEPSDKVRFEGKRIGRIELHFEGAPSQIADLILGRNIREWAIKNPGVVDTFSDTKTMQNVWQSLNCRFVQDMLRIAVEGGPKRLVRIKIVGEFEEDVRLQEGKFPTIQVAAISCRVAAQPTA